MCDDIYNPALRNNLSTRIIIMVKNGLTQTFDVAWPKQIVEDHLIKLRL